MCENFDEMWTYYPFIVTKMKEISFLLILGMKFEELMNYYRFLYEKAKHRISSKACLKSINLKKKKSFIFPATKNPRMTTMGRLLEARNATRRLPLWTFWIDPERMSRFKPRFHVFPQKLICHISWSYSMSWDFLNTIQTYISLRITVKTTSFSLKAYFHLLCKFKVKIFLVFLNSFIIVRIYVLRTSIGRVKFFIIYRLVAEFSQSSDFMCDILQNGRGLAILNPVLFQFFEILFSIVLFWEKIIIIIWFSQINLNTDAWNKYDAFKNLI